MPEWIKVESSTPRKPEISAIAIALKKTRRDTRREALGLAVEFWLWADQNSVNGELRCTKEQLDGTLSCKGCADHFINVGWLKETAEGELHIPNFMRHNGQSTKRRATNARAQAVSRSRKEAEASAICQQSVSTDADQKRKEKKKEIKKEKEEAQKETSPEDGRNATPEEMTAIFKEMREE